MTIQFTKAVGYFRSFITDGVDPDETPDIVKLTGTITLTPNVPYVVDISNPDGGFYGSSPFIGEVKDGRLVTPGQPYGWMWLVSTGNPDLDPKGWQYNVVYDLKTPDGRKINIPSVTIVAPTDQTIDLSRLVPAPNAPVTSTSIAEAAALRAEAALAKSVRFVNDEAPDANGNVYVLFPDMDKTDVGLDNVDNTSDLSKPVSLATALELQAKASTATSIGTGTGLQGGGTLAASRTISLTPEAIASLAKADALAASLGATARIAPNSQEFTGGNLNTALSNGWVSGSNMTNAPTLDPYYVQIQRIGDGGQYAVQEAILAGKGPQSGDTYRRFLEGAGGWTSWVRIANYLGAIDQPARDAAAAKYTKPAGGISNPDFAASVNTSLGKADSAVQPSALATALIAKADLVNGVLPTSQLPALAINDIFTASNQAAMLALTAQRGDMAIRTDSSSTFVLATDDPTVLGNWKVLPTPSGSAIISINGQTSGAIVLGKGDIGLGNVANLAPADLPLSTAATNAFGLKLNTAAASASQVFAKDAAGAATGLPYGTAATANALPLRDANSQLAVPVLPTSNIHATSKQYVDAGDIPLAAGQRLGPLGKSVAGTDANLLTDQGWYVGTGMTNAPTQNYCYIEVRTHTDNAWVLQRWTEYADTAGGPIATPKTWTRQKQSAAWQPYVLAGTTASSNTHPASAGSAVAITVDGTQATTQVITMTGNTTVTLGTGSPSSGAFFSNLVLKQDATGSRTVTWPAAILWGDGTPPVLSTAANAVNRVQLLWDGVEWSGALLPGSFSRVPTQSTKTIFTQSMTPALSAWATEGNVTSTGGVLTIAPAATAWASGIKAFLATTDNFNGSTATGTPAAVADMTARFTLELLDLSEQYPLIAIRTRSTTYQNVIDDLWASGNSAGQPKKGYFVVLSPAANILSIWDAATGLQVGSNIPFTFPNKKMDVLLIVAGKSLQLKLWTSGTAEPATWAINLPTPMYAQIGGHLGFVAGNGPAAVSKYMKISNLIITTPIKSLALAGGSVAAPTSDPAGFTRIYTENFTTDATTGTGASSVLALYGSRSLQLYNDEGVYWPRYTTSVHDGVLDVNLPGDKGAAFVFGGTDIAYNRVGGRFAFRAMAIDAIGNGTATMIWPSARLQADGTNGERWADGEIDYPESNFEDTPFVHHHLMTVGQESSSDNYNTAISWRDWHVYSVEWYPPGKGPTPTTGSVRYFVDEQLVYTVTHDVPTVAHRFMFQIGNYGQPGHFYVDWATMSSLN